MKNVKKLTNMLMFVFIMTLFMGIFTGNALAKAEEGNKYNFRVMRFFGKPNCFDTLEELPTEVTITKREDGMWNEGANIYRWGYYNEGEKIIPVELKVDIKTNDKYNNKPIIRDHGICLGIYAPGSVEITFTPKDEELAKKLGSVTHKIRVISEEEKIKKDKEKYNFRVMRFFGKPNCFDTLEELPTEVTITKREDGMWNEGANIYRWGYYNEGEKIIPVELKVDIKTNDKYNNKPIIRDHGICLGVYAPGSVEITFTPKDEELAKKLGSVTHKIRVIDASEKTKPAKPFSINVEIPSNIKAGQDMNIVATAKCSEKISEQEKNALLIVALYKTEGLSSKMVTYAYGEKTMEPGKTVKLGAGFNIPEDTNGYKVKVFVWDAWPNENKGGKALSDVKEFVVE